MYGKFFGFTYDSFHFKAGYDPRGQYDDEGEEEEDHCLNFGCAFEFRGHRHAFQGTDRDSTALMELFFRQMIYNVSYARLGRVLLVI